MTSDLVGGRKETYDPAPALKALAEGDVAAAWDALWDNLHHQGDIGTASYAAVPDIVRIAIDRDFRDWNAYALVAVIEECRLSGRNPVLPSSLEAPYFKAMSQLADKGAAEIGASNDQALTQSILAVLAFAKGAPLIGSFALLTISEQEEAMREEIVPFIAQADTSPVLKSPPFFRRLFASFRKR